MSRKWKLAVYVAIPCALLLLVAASGRQSRQSDAGQNITANTTDPNVSGGELTSSAGKAIVGIGRGVDHAAVVAQAIANAGGLEGVVSKGDTVIIKPNLSSSRGTLTYPGNTDYRVVAEVVQQARALGAGRVIVAEGAGTGKPLSDPTIRLIRFNTIEGVEFLDLNTIPREECYYVSSPKKLTEEPIYMPKIYVDADVVISVPKLKTNYAVGPSLGLKNGFGAPPKPLMNDGTAWKWGLHNRGIENSIVEINLLRKPDFVVIDGIVAGEGNGPTNNDPVDAQIVLAGTDVMAVDTIASYFMGFTPQKLPHLKLAAENGLGEYRMEHIEVVGANIHKIRMDFASPFPKD
ncbi:MAG: DUF362 domain-containing protein [Synergistaceae bacterium]|jgi:uncharacterized protein (DUF362 family)|nr:DUF362 domain-containing protein [Synergistaceae bacterium]